MLGDFLYIIKYYFQEMVKRNSGKRNRKGAKWAGIILLVAAWIVLGARLAYKSDANEKKQAVSAFSSAITNECEASVTAYGRYNPGSVSDGTKVIILTEIADKIGINRYEIQDYYDEKGAAVKSLSQSSSNGDVVVKFLDKEQDQCYIYVDIILKNSVDCVYTYEEIVRDIYEDMGIDTCVNVNLTGEIAGRLYGDNCRAYTESLMEKAGAKQVYAKEYDGIYTAYGYNKKMDEWVNIGGKKVNVNVTVNYNEQTGKSVIHLATPIMQQDF